MKRSRPASRLLRRRSGDQLRVGDATIELRIFERRPTEIESAFALLDRALGEGYVDPQSLGPALGNGLARGAFTSGQLIGLVFGRLPAEGDDLIGLTGTERAQGPIGYVSTVAVEDAWRRRGIGTELVRALLRDWRGRGATLVTTHVWKESPAPANGVFERCGFEFRLPELPEYWRADSERRGYLCPVGHKPCTCTAQVYVLDLREPALRL